MDWFWRLRVIVMSAVCVSGYYYEIPSLSAIRINTQVNITSAWPPGLHLSRDGCCFSCIRLPNLVCILPSCGGLTSVHVAGVPGCFRPAHGQGSQKGQAGSVDQRLPGCTGTWFASMKKKIKQAPPTAAHNHVEGISAPSPQHKTCFLSDVRLQISVVLFVVLVNSASTLFGQCL